VAFVRPLSLEPIVAGPALSRPRTSGGSIAMLSPEPAPAPNGAAEPPPRVGRSLSRRLVRAAGAARNSEAITVGELVGRLGDRSFGWCIVVFALLNLIPMPFGSMVMALPLILVAAQMALGLPELRLPPRLAARRIDRRRFQSVVMRIRPLIRPVEAAVRPRRTGVFGRRNERLMGLVLLAVAVALFVPFPLSGYLPALSLLLTGVGLVERDGLVALIGLGMGLLAVTVTIGVGAALALGVQFLAV
jgi:hypothetical protein